MIDRSEYLQMCRECAMLKTGVSGIVLDVPDELRILHNNSEFYPIGYSIYFNEDGSARHIAILHDLKASAVYDVGLKDIEKKE